MKLRLSVEEAAEKFVERARPLWGLGKKDELKNLRGELSQAEESERSNGHKPRTFLDYVVESCGQYIDTTVGGRRG